MTTLVTGSTGLLGSAIKNMNPSAFVYSSSSDFDLTSFESTLEMFNYYRPTSVLHLAARVGGIGGNLMRSGEYYKDNILINTHVLEAARIYKVERLYSLMSTCVFPDKIDYPLVPEQLHQGPPHESNFAYAYTKRMLAVQSAAYRQQFGCRFSIVVPSNLYGEHDNFHLSEGHVIPALIHKAYLCQESSKPFRIWGTGRPLREFIYAKDLARILISSIQNYDFDIPLIISPPKEYSIAEVALEIAKNFGIESQLEFEADKPDGQLRKPSDASKFNFLWPNFEFTNLSEGINYTSEWFRSNFDKCRK